MDSTAYFLTFALLLGCSAAPPGDDETTSSTGDSEPPQTTGDVASSSSAGVDETSSSTGDEPSPTTGDDETGGAELPLLVITVDADGEPVLAPRVLVQPAPADAFWLAATEAACVDEHQTPPCSHWSVAPPTSGQLAVSADRTTDAAGECIAYASTFALVHPPTPETPNQILRLTLPSDGTYCIDPNTGRAVVNVEHDEDVTGDTLAVPAPPGGPLTVHIEDQHGDPVPASGVHWYYSPEGPDYDGEHPLRCADVRCETWVLTEEDAGPHAGVVYLSATYAGPLNPFFQQGWSGYAGGPHELAARDDGALVPVDITLTLATDEEAAIGG